ncbi:Tetratricopeptide repeat-containing protein [bacterium A37T11]|nr:Tetratricopeptide repeat-containing protein [bacterium A37T11]
MYITSFSKILTALVAFALLGSVRLAAQTLDSVTVNSKLSTSDSLKVKDLFFSALRQKESGNLEEAVESLLQILNIDTQNEAANYELSRISFQQKDYGKAAAYAREAVNVNPNNEKYWNVLADVYKQMEDFASLVPVFDQLIRLKPKVEQPYYDKAYALFLTKKYDAALDQYKLIEKNFGSNDTLFMARQQIYLAQNQSEKAIGAMLSRKQKNPKDKRNYLLLADLYLKLKQPKDALDALDSANILFPDDPYVSISKAEAYHALRKESASFNEMKKAFQSDSMNIEAKIQVLMSYYTQSDKSKKAGFVNELANMLTQKYAKDGRAFAVNGDLLMRQDRQNEAHTQYLTAIKLDPKMEGVWEQLLQLEMTMGLLKEAEAHGKQATAIFTNHPVILFFAGQAALVNHNYKDARGYLESALNNAPENNALLTGQIYSGLGDTYHNLKMYDESDVAYGEALSLDSNNVYVLNNYAYYLALRNAHLDEAARMAAKVNELEPDNSSYEDTYAWVLYYQGKYEQAAEWIKKAIDHSDDASDTLLDHYGDILFKQGKIDDAVTYWEKAKGAASLAGKNVDSLLKKINDRQIK